MNKYFDLAIAMAGVCSLGLAAVPTSENQTSPDYRGRVTNIQLPEINRSFSFNQNQSFTPATSYSILNREPEPIPVSAIAINLVKEFEGFSDRAYLDTDGTPVIGYGLSRINGKSVQLGDRISQAEADAALRAELHTIKQQLKGTVKPKLKESQLSALASLSYNVGFEPIKTSTLVKKINAGDYLGAANEFLRWDKANVRGALVQLPGLSRRRQAERQLFLQ